MIRLNDKTVYLVDGRLQEQYPEDANMSQNAAAGTMAYAVLSAHNTSGSMEKLQIKFDKLISHDITYVGIIQTARASGLEEFPVPYAMTCCHNSLCAVGGTINEDDHVFGLTCAKKYGGIFVPPHQAVIHQYAREMMSSVGGMILGSDSHTRYGALGTMGIGEGGGELAKQLLSRTYDIDYPEVVCVYLTGRPEIGVGPQDVALALIGAVFKNGFVKNRVLEFTGPGIGNLSVDFRIGIDVMTTETTCLSSIWETDDKVREFYEIHGRLEDFRELHPERVAKYDRLIEIELDKVKPMIAMPVHPSNAYTIEDFKANIGDIVSETEKNAKTALNYPDFDLHSKLIKGQLYVEQGIIGGCAGGGFENLCAAADILRGHSVGAGEFSLSIYPASTPVYMELVKNGACAEFIKAGAIMKTAFCGPCFGAGDTPSNGGFSIRHSTRNFPNREGSKPGNGQNASVALMDARSIAATAANKGMLTAATDFDTHYSGKKYFFDRSIYEARVFDGFGNADPSQSIKQGPNIKDWPDMDALPENLLIRIVSEIHDPVTTTDELIPSGETSSYRSNPLGLAEFTLSRKDPAYVGKAKEVRELAIKKKTGNAKEEYPEYGKVIRFIEENFGVKEETVGIGSSIYAVKPGDGSAREQAASCQRVLGASANIAKEYATKRYRSNLINWGMIPFLYDKDELQFSKGDWIYIPDIAEKLKKKELEYTAYVIRDGSADEITLRLDPLTDDETEIIEKGCLINYYRS